MDKVGKILPRVVARQPAGPLLKQMQVAHALRAVLGAELASACGDVSLDRGTLRMTTSNAALAHQLRDDAEHVLVRLNQMLQLTRPVRRLHVRIGSRRA